MLHQDKEILIMYAWRTASRGHVPPGCSPHGRHERSTLTDYPTAILLQAGHKMMQPKMYTASSSQSCMHPQPRAASVLCFSGILGKLELIALSNYNILSSLRARIMRSYSVILA